MNVMPHVTAYASNGGVSNGFAQFDFGNASPRVARPSLRVGSNGVDLIDRGVESANGCGQLGCVDAVDLARQRIDRIGGDARDLANAIFVAQQRRDLRVEDLPRDLSGLLQDLAAVFRIRVVAEVGALVDEALAARVHHDAERVGVLLKTVADGEIAELRRVRVPADRVATGPVAARRGADVERHTNAVAGVEARAAHAREVPAGTEIARAPRRIRFEAARGENHRIGVDRFLASAAGDAHTGNAAGLASSVRPRERRSAVQRRIVLRQR